MILSSLKLGQSTPTVFCSPSIIINDLSELGHWTADQCRHNNGLGTNHLFPPTSNTIGCQKCCRTIIESVEVNLIPMNVSPDESSPVDAILCARQLRQLTYALESIQSEYQCIKEASDSFLNSMLQWDDYRFHPFLGWSPANSAASFIWPSTVVGQCVVLASCIYAHECCPTVRKYWSPQADPA